MKKLFFSMLWLGFLLTFFLWRYYGGYEIGPDIPLPGPGYKAWDFFYIPSGGDFYIKVETPRQADGKDDDNAFFAASAIPCDLDIKVRDESSGEEWHRHTAQVKCGSAGPTLGYSEEGSSNWIHLPRSGKYSLTVVNHARLEPFEKTGAMVTLEKAEDVGPSLGWMILRFLALVFLSAGSLGLTVLEIKALRNRKRAYDNVR